MRMAKCQVRVLNAMQTDREKYFSDLVVLTHSSKLERFFGQQCERHF